MRKKKKRPDELAVVVMMMSPTGLAVDYKNIAKRRTITTIYYLYSTIYYLVQEIQIQATCSGLSQA